MTDTQQGKRQQSARDASGTTDTHSGDLRALFESVATVPAGSTYNEAFILWLQSVTGSSADNINDLTTLYASQQEDTYNWSSVGSLGLPVLFTWNPELGEALPAAATFIRPTVAWYRNDSGLWVEATSGELRLHNATPGGGEKGYLPETTSTKLALFPRDLTNGVWSATNITAAKDATGIDGVSNSASTLTADANNGTIFQSFTRASSAHSFQCFVARKTGTGTVEITIDGGTTWVDVTSSLTSSIDNPFVVTQTLANPSIGFRLGTSGDEIEVDMADLEATSFATTPMDHTSATISRNRDELVVSGLLTQSPYSINCDYTWGVDLVDDEVLFSTANDRYRYQNSFTGRRVNYSVSGVDMDIIPGFAEGLREKAAIRFEDNNCAYIVTSQSIKTDVITSSMITGDFGIGMSEAANTKQWRGLIHNITVLDGAQSDSQLADYVAPP